MRTAFHIDDLWDYGALIAYAIDRGIDVRGVSWNGIEHDEHAYFIGYDRRRLYKRRKSILIERGFDIVIPEFRSEEDGSVSMYIMTKYDDIQSCR